MSPVADSHEGFDTRTRIMAASRKLFSLKGFHSVPMAQLAIEARASVGQIYRHFPSKAAIIRAIVEEDIHDNLEMLGRVFGAAGTDKNSLAGSIERVIYAALTTPSRCLMLKFIAESHRNAQVAAVIDRLTDLYVNAYETSRPKSNLASARPPSRVS